LLGVFFGVLFRMAGGNLLALWSVTWAVTSSIGVLEGGFGFDWSDIAAYALLLIVQVAAIPLWRGTPTGLVGRGGGVLERLEPPRMPRRLTVPMR